MLEAGDEATLLDEGQGEEDEEGIEEDGVGKGGKPLPWGGLTN